MKSWRRALGGMARILGPLLGLGLVVAFFAVWTGDLARAQDGKPLVFLSPDNLRNVANQTTIIALIAVGMTLIIIGGGIDLSIGSIVAVCGVVGALVFNGSLSGTFSVAGPWVPASQRAALYLSLPVVLLALQYAATRSLNVGRGLLMLLVYFGGLIALQGSGGAAAVAACVFVGLACGYLNGLIISLSRVVPFIITLGTMEAFRGVAEMLSKETKVQLTTRGFIDENSWVADLTRPYPSQDWLIVAPGVWIMAIAAIAMMVLLRYTRLGRYIFAIGSNEEAARLSGVPVNAVKIWMYALCGLFTGLAGALQFARLANGDPTVGKGFELKAIAAVVIGGGSLRGGEGSVFGTLIGAFLMSFLENGCNIAHVPAPAQRILIGGIIVLAVALDEFRHRGRR
jgi:ribose/xylose/arabinose/galactoside ABC-type transport system permease subunit